MGSLGVGHNWATSLSLFTFMHWRRKWQPTPVFLPGESQRRGSLVGCHLWVAQSQTRMKRLSSSSSGQICGPQTLWPNRWVFSHSVFGIYYCSNRKLIWLLSGVHLYHLGNPIHSKAWGCPFYHLVHVYWFYRQQREKEKEKQNFGQAFQSLLGNSLCMYRLYMHINEVFNFLIYFYYFFWSREFFFLIGG